MNPYLKKTRGLDNNWSLSLPQVFNRTGWMLSISTVATNYLEFCIFDTDQTNADPFYFISETIPLQDVTRLCMSDKKHDELILYDRKTRTGLVLIANYMYGTFSLEDIVLIIRSDVRPTIHLVMKKSWFTQK